MKKYAVAAVFILIVSGGLIFSAALPDGDVSLTERRSLAKAPSLTWQSFVSDGFSKSFDKYAADQFAFRDSLRSISSFTRLKLLAQLDTGGVFEYGGGIYKLENHISGFPSRLARDINGISSRHFSDCNVYACVIPDKTHFISASGYPLTEQRTVVSEFVSGLDKNISYIDLYDVLDLDDYYKTDLHWRQERLQPVIDSLSEAMGFPAADLSEYERRSFAPFYGGYYGMLGLGGAGDELIYLTSPYTDAAAARETDGEKKSVYYTDGLNGIDPYDVFLYGAVPLITVENAEARTKKELVIFRDSFASSLAPLLTESYASITLADLRYLSSSLIGEYIAAPPKSDVLFIYSASVPAGIALK